MATKPCKSKNKIIIGGIATRTQMTFHDFGLSIHFLANTTHLSPDPFNFITVNLMVAAYVDPRDEEIKDLKSLVTSGYMLVETLLLLLADNKALPSGSMGQMLAIGAGSFLKMAKVHVPQHMLDFLEAADKKDMGEKK